MATENWGTTTIYANPDPSSGYYPNVDMRPGTGAASDRNSVPQMLAERRVTRVFANGKNIFDVVKSGNVIETINQMMIGWNYIDQAAFRNQLSLYDKLNRNLFYSGQREFPLFVPVNRVETLSTYALSSGSTQPSSPYSFYGSPLMLGTALHYWVNGHGEDRNVHISSLNVNPSIGNFTAITSVVAANGPGTYPINSTFSVNLFDNASSWYAAVVFGRIGGKVNGTLNINPDGNWSFNGSFSLNRDLFNADHSSRNWVQERMTDTLRLIGDVFGHADYYINVVGEQQIQFSGHK